MPVPFVGPSYHLRSRTADVQRTIGMIPVPMEPGNERAVWAFKDIPGLVQAWDLGAEFRGAWSINGRTFAVAGSKLYELGAEGSQTDRGSLASSVGRVGMVSNTTQLVVADESKLYVMTLADNVLQSADFPGGARIDYLDQYIVYRTRDSQQFGWTSLGDATSIDALDFASAEASPDNLVGIIVDHRELLLFGSDSTESWSNTTDASIFARNQGVAIEYGLASEWSACKLDSSVYFLASSSRGQGQVMKLQGYVPVPVSTAAIEQILAGLDLSEAYAFAIEMERSKLYCLNVPGVETTLVYDALTQQWHEWAELVNGQRTQHRATHHFFTSGQHYVGTASGKVYRLDPRVSNNAGDPLLRERITPVSATPSRDRLHYSQFDLTCDRGTGGSVALRYSIDGGARWSNWRTRSVGALGKFHRLVQWKRFNAGRDFVVNVRCTDDVPFNPVSGGMK